MFRYDNIGGKIKTLAKVMFIVEAIAGGLFGLVMTITSGRNLGLMLLGLLIIFVAALVAWVSSFLLYGFGELIEKTGEIARNTRGNVAVSETQARANDERIATAERLRAQGLISEEEYRQVVTRK